MTPSPAPQPALPEPVIAASAHGLREVAWFDCPGGGQVVVDQGIAYIGHMKHPAGTSTVDVRDPANPRQLDHLQMPPGMHAHKVRVANGLMLTNREFVGPMVPSSPDLRGGLAIHDVSTPGRPRHITDWRIPGNGVHRFDFDGRYAYLSATQDGYVGTIMVILDLADPAKPVEAGRWWMEGQWTAGGETPSWDKGSWHCHHPLRRGDRLYVSYWHGGFAILDIADISRPRRVGGFRTAPPHPWPTHTALPLPYRLRGRDVLLVADEDAAKIGPGEGAYLWLYDITDEAHPVPFSTFQVAGDDGTPVANFTGCHQPSEIVTGTEIPVAWFAHGLRIVDIANPHAIREVAHFVPPLRGAMTRAQSNDVTVDERGLIYVIDRVQGLTILERI